jgi:hypothetical protein
MTLVLQWLPSMSRLAALVASALAASALCASLAAPAAAQTGSVVPAGNPLGLRAGDAGWTGSVFVGGQGLNPDRARMSDPGLRLPAASLPASSPPLRLGPPVDPASAAQAGAYIGYRHDKWTLSSGVRQGLGAGAGGTRLDLGASYGFNVAPRHLITLSGGLTLGASTPLASYYEVYGTDAFWRYGYRAGEPGAGLRLSWRYDFERSTAYFATTLGYDRAYGDLDSQPGLDRNTTTFGTTFGYRW